MQGITRKKIVRLCVDQKIPLITKDIPLSEIQQFEGAFLTGSSPKVLPVSAIEEVKFDPGLSLIKKIISLYDKEIEKYIKNEHDKTAK